VNPTTPDEWWLSDLELSNKFMPLVIDILKRFFSFNSLTDNQGTEKDRQGKDITLINGNEKINIGVRIRRWCNPEKPKIIYHKYDEYTEDDKERDTMTCDWHFYAYVNEKYTDFYSWILFDHSDFVEGKKNKLLLVGREKNQDHSTVCFSTYPLCLIKKYCAHVSFGNIGKKPIQQPIL